MHPVVRRLINLYPLVKKFPMPVSLILLVVGGILYSYTLMLIGAVMLVWRVWEVAYINAQLHAKLDAEEKSSTTTGSGA